MAGWGPRHGARRFAFRGGAGRLAGMSESTLVFDGHIHTHGTPGDPPEVFVEKAREAENLKDQDKETTEKLSQLANDLASAYSALGGGGAEKWLKDARIKGRGLERKAANYSKESIEKIENVIKKKAEEDAKKAAAEKAAAEKAAAEERHKELIAKERAKAQEAFDDLLDEIKGLKWDRCTSRLTRRREQMKTREGEAAVDGALKMIGKVEDLRAFLEINDSINRNERNEEKYKAFVEEANKHLDLGFYYGNGKTKQASIQAEAYLKDKDEWRKEEYWGTRMVLVFTDGTRTSF